MDTLRTATIAILITVLVLFGGSYLLKQMKGNETPPANLVEAIDKATPAQMDKAEDIIKKHQAEWEKQGITN